MARADKLLVEEQTTLFAFDAFGNLARTTDPKNNVVAVSYDNWGRRKQLKDPDLGTINYGVDALGQVRSQVSPNEAAAGQQTVMEYDALGRMTSRLAADMHAVWTYDQLPSQSGCQASRSCGKLVESKTLAGGAAVDFLQQHSYDLLGRPELTTTVLDQPYTSRRVYDSWGRLVSEQHQYGSGAAKAYDRRYNAWGQLWKIEGKGQVLWQASAKDAAQRLTGWSLGNGLAATRVFNPYTGRLMSGSVGTKLGEAYQYDVLGNVSQRLQIWEASSFTENFDYDGLNRLKMATIVGFPAQEFTYDDIGNLLTKSGVGSGPYVYPASGANSVRPHAVASIPGLAGGEFGYDLNGNMTSGAGRTVSWTSFDMPNTISKGAASSTFYYGADRQRVKQQRNDGSTVWYAGALEVETGSGGATVKTYLPDGIGVEIEKAGGSTLYYLHRDRLGSVVAMSSQAGELVESQAYDSWGKRREQASPATPDQLDGVLDNKGFTGHEMLDQLDLVHMNGRVYDPLVARFMSADPIIQEPEHSQSYNRYTYVWNNPTNLTDPTGFIGEGPRPANSVIPECQDSRTECGSGGKPSRDEQPQSNENKPNKGKERNSVPGQSANTNIFGSNVVPGLGPTLPIVSPAEAPKSPPPQEGVESICPECYLIGSGGVGRFIAALLGRTAEKAMASAFATEAGTAFFWSGRTGAVGGADVAASIAKANGGTTLEMLLARRNITMPAWDSANPAVVKAWQDVSAAYAANASGTVRAVVGQNLRPGNVWETAELPALMRNSNVTRIITIDPASLASKTIYVRK